MSGTQLREHLIGQFGSNATRFLAEVSASCERLICVSEILCFECVLRAAEIESYFSQLPPFEREIANKGRCELDDAIGELRTLIELHNSSFGKAS